LTPDPILKTLIQTTNVEFGEESFRISLFFLYFLNKKIDSLDKIIWTVTMKNILDFCLY